MRRGATLIETIVALSIGLLLMVLLWQLFHQATIEGEQIEHHTEGIEALSFIRESLVRDLARAASPDAFPGSVPADGTTADHLDLIVTARNASGGLDFHRLTYHLDAGGALWRGTQTVKCGPLTKLAFVLDRANEAVLRVTVAGPRVGAEATMAVPLPASFALLSGWQIAGSNRPVAN